MARSNLVLQAFEWKRLKKVHFSVATCIVLFDTIMHSNSRGQGHLLILPKGHLSIACQYLQRTVALKLLDQFLLNFICRLLAKGSVSTED